MGGFWGSQGRGAYINGRYVANATKGSGKGRGQENVLTTRWSLPWDVLVTINLKIKTSIPNTHAVVPGSFAWSPPKRECNLGHWTLGNAWDP